MGQVPPRLKFNADGLHAKFDGAIAISLQISITRKRPEWKILGISMIAKVENTRESRSRIARLIPKTFGVLLTHEIVYATRNSGMISGTSGHQPQERPRGLRCRARCRLISCVVESIARPILPPSTVRILDVDEPHRRTLDLERMCTQASSVECTQGSPGAINVVHPPTAIPTAVGFL